jgi:hypothetical protein
MMQPYEGYGDFNADIAIRRVSDGVVRVMKMRECRSSVVYGWSDGNYACDCNRGLFFARAVGEEDPDVECGEVVYKIDCIKDAETGEVLYTEA